MFIFSSLALANFLGMAIGNSTFSSTYELYHQSNTPGMINLNADICPYQPSYDFYNNSLYCLPDNTPSSPVVRKTIRYGINDYYIGETVNGIKQGKGRFFWPSGQSYKGQFENDKRHGVGNYSWPNGEWYYGQFENDKIHGVGHHSWPNGEWYYGQFENNKIHGVGNHSWPDGGWYYGQFENNKRHGVGTFSFPIGRSYTGIFINDAAPFWSTHTLNKLLYLPVDQRITVQRARTAINIIVSFTFSIITISYIFEPANEVRQAALWLNNHLSFLSRYRTIL